MDRGFLVLRATARRYHTTALTQPATNGHQPRSRSAAGSHSAPRPNAASASNRSSRRGRTERRRSIHSIRPKRRASPRPVAVTRSRRTTISRSSASPTTGSHSLQSVRSPSKSKAAGREGTGVELWLGCSQLKADRKRPEGSWPFVAATARACSISSESGSRRGALRPEFVVSRTDERAGTAIRPHSVHGGVSSSGETRRLTVKIVFGPTCAFSQRQHVNK